MGEPAGAAARAVTPRSAGSLDSAGGLDSAGSLDSDGNADSTERAG